MKIWFQNRRAREKRNIEVSEKTKKSPKINLLTPGQSQHSSAQALFIHNSEKNLNSFIHLSPFDLLNCVDSENNFFVTPLDLSERNFVHRTR